MGQNNKMKNIILKKDEEINSLKDLVSEFEKKSPSLEKNYKILEKQNMKNETKIYNINNDKKVNNKDKENNNEESIKEMKIKLKKKNIIDNSNKQENNLSKNKTYEENPKSISLISDEDEDIKNNYDKDYDSKYSKDYSMNKITNRSKK